jgi:hypothetical protein
MRKHGDPMFKKIAFTMYPVRDAKRAHCESTFGLLAGSKSSTCMWAEDDLLGRFDALAAQV